MEYLLLELVQEYLERAVALKPYGTIEIFVSRDDLRGGTGANFVVHWAAAEQATKPIIEAVMIGSTGAATYSLVSHGRTVGISSAHNTGEESQNQQRGSRE